ncbi:MAG: helix-turn-helix domain-containing protein [Bryobacterales bacterium]|nr:helix-turn-helix domain-containing protein [Bryobacterales bacterium]
MEEEKGKRVHSPEFRVEIAEKMLAGGNVSALAEEFDLPRSMMYRWRDAYRADGPAGLKRRRGRPPGIGTLPQTKPAGSRRPNASKAPGPSDGAEEALRARIAELERKVGQQAVEIDFFKRVFRRLEELPKAPKRGGDASTQRS